MEERMSTPTDSRPELITVIAYVRAKTGREQELRDALLALVEPTTQEQGFVNYDLHQDISDPTFFALYENWETVDLHDAHMETPHLQDFGSRLDGLLDGPLNVHQMRRIA
jgi:quinol monooxygenase YgiN